jgi:hypothetical protein
MQVFINNVIFLKKFKKEKRNFNKKKIMFGGAPLKPKSKIETSYPFCNIVLTSLG